MLNFRHFRTGIVEFNHPVERPESFATIARAASYNAQKRPESVEPRAWNWSALLLGFTLLFVHVGCTHGRRSLPRFLVPDASGASVDQVDCLVRADADIGHIRRLTVGVFPAQIHVTILALRYFSPRPLAGFQRA
jgi:hypothetical protein